MVGYSERDGVFRKWKKMRDLPPERHGFKGEGRGWIYGQKLWGVEIETSI